MSGLKYKVVLALVLAFTAPAVSGCTATLVCDPLFTCA
ncbi:hypothetical protein MAAFP003_3871 [Mycobacterium ahvazicum]|uniref:Lipoprotein n=1 Tax=Mycobacterium ahvazicum TaxID=1964395 RepID=A0A2K4YEG5_9MYCO|nr:hypothetical protein MAAFP003_3871 [Mycobacterium ahvazicum]